MVHVDLETFLLRIKKQSGRNEVTHFFSHIFEPLTFGGGTTAIRALTS